MCRQKWVLGYDDGPGLYYLYYGQLNEEGLCDGVGIIYWSDGDADIVRNKAGESVGKGVRWSADRKTIMLLKDGEEAGETLSADADAVELGKKIVGELPLLVPPPTYEEVCADHAPPHHSRVLFFSRGAFVGDTAARHAARGTPSAHIVDACFAT